jgi:hypothetical protein
MRPLIPKFDDVVEALTFMQANHFRNRHPEAGAHYGLLMTYFELLGRQEREQREKEEQQGRKNHENGIFEGGGAAGTEKRLAAAEGGAAHHAESSGERDSMAIRDDAGSQDSTGQDTGTDGEQDGGRGTEKGVSGGRDGVERPPEPDTPLKSRLAYWKSRI